MQEPKITPLARRLAEDAGVAWHTVVGTEGGTITERDVLVQLTEVVTGNGPAETTGLAEAVDFSSLALSLAEALQELWVEPGEAARGSPKTQALKPEGPEPQEPEPQGPEPREPEPQARASGAAGVSAPAGTSQHLQALLEAERLAHAETQRRLSALEETVKQQKARAAQLRPLASEIRRLGSALGVANAEMERLRPLETLVNSLQKQLQEARTDEAKTRLGQELQAQQDLLEARKKRPRWQLWRRTS